MSGSSSGIGSDIGGGLSLLGGGALTLAGMPEIGLPLMLGGTGGLIGGNTAGGKGALLGGLSGLGAGVGADVLGAGGGLGGLFGSEPTSAALAAPTSMGSIGAPAGTLAGMPYYDASQYAAYGAGPSASFAPPVAPPPAALSPAGGGAAPPASPIASPLGGGPSVPAPPLGGVTGGGPGQYYFNGQSWVQNPDTSSPSSTTGQLAMQDSSQVGQAYLQYLQQLNLQKYRPTYAPTHSSAVGAPTYNPLAPVPAAGIRPPQLVV